MTLFTEKAPAIMSLLMADFDLTVPGTFTKFGEI
jgi:hypothetical protein